MYSGPYAEIYHREAGRHGLDGNLVAAVAWRESRHNPNAVGDAGCSCGLMQLNWCVGAGAGYSCRQLQDPALNVALGAAYLRRCADAFPGDWTRAVAAYRQGIGGVRVHGPIDEGRYITQILAKWREYAGDDSSGWDPSPTPAAPSAEIDPRVWLIVGGLFVAWLVLDW